MVRLPALPKELVEGGAHGDQWDDLRDEWRAAVLEVLRAAGPFWVSCVECREFTDDAEGCPPSFLPHEVRIKAEGRAKREALAAMKWLEIEINDSAELELEVE